ncbi:unnamed protein product [Brugia timori]|uniref:Uncharacterized protein n=1 Tax=Brugia timori TaxID=42155 RepID=A0A0R3R722_9BILA|nr:unnamed protein product [Brugia timori]
MDGIAKITFRTNYVKFDSLIGIFSCFRHSTFRFRYVICYCL